MSIITGKGADLWHPIRTATEQHVREDDLATQNRRCVLNVGRWARRHEALAEEVRELVEMLGLDVEAATNGR